MIPQVQSEPRIDVPVREEPPHAEMVWIAGGTFRMGSERHYPEEAPVHHVTVAPFRIDRTAVTNSQFRQFVEATGYITVAEQAPDPKDYSGALPHMLKPGSLVFTPAQHPVDLRDWRQWWKFEFGANWRRPYGRGKSNSGLDDHPVVHVALQDAEAYAVRAGKALPTEAEWEYAARGGLDGAEFAWGDELTPGGHHAANTWQGRFPFENLATDGYTRTSPVKAFRRTATAFSTWSATCGNGPRIGTRRITPPTLRRRAASRKSARWAGTRQLRRVRAAGADSAQGRQRRLASLRAELIAADIGRPHATRSRSIQA
jgi:formylglycine-generating enzyme required for sulfatase activity